MAEQGWLAEPLVGPPPLGIPARRRRRVVIPLTFGEARA